MLQKKLFYFYFLILTIIGCGKSNDDTQPQNNNIDVSEQWISDPSGFILHDPGDDQWENKVYTASELNLFNSLDTSNLIGTSVPDSLSTTFVNHLPYPNPFNPVHRISFLFTSGFSGNYVLKYVIVDSLMNSLVKKVVRLQGNTSATVMPEIPVGRFRLYYTLSSLDKPHFFKTWGNIQKTP